MAIPTKKQNPDGRKPDLWPEQWYELFVANAFEKSSTNSGNLMAVLELEAELDGNTRVFTMYVPYADKHGKQTSWCEQMIDALTTDADKRYVLDDAGNPVLDADGKPQELGLEPGELIGRQCLGRLEYEHDTWKGRPQVKERIMELKRHPEGVYSGEAPAQVPAANDALPAPDDDLPF